LLIQNHIGVVALRADLNQSIEDEPLVPFVWVRLKNLEMKIKKRKGQKNLCAFDLELWDFF
jgi:hypothetical protein